jgi:hypothetical protein
MGAMSRLGVTLMGVDGMGVPAEELTGAVIVFNC